MPLRREFDELEIDALTELINISVSSAAVSLSRIIHEEVLLTVPAISIVGASEITKLVSPDTAPLRGVRQEFGGDLAGQALLLFTHARCTELADLVAGRLAGAAADPEVVEDALRETGNIVLQSCLSAIANLLRRRFEIGDPVIFEAAPDALLKPGAIVLFIFMDFHVRGHSIQGYVALLLDLPSLDNLRSMIREFIRNASAEYAAETPNHVSR